MVDLKTELCVKKEALAKLERVGQQLVGQIQLLEYLITESEKQEEGNDNGEGNNS